MSNDTCTHLGGCMCGCVSSAGSEMVKWELSFTDDVSQCYYLLKNCVLPKSVGWSLNTPTMWLCFKRGPLRRWGRLNEVIRVGAQSNRPGILIRRVGDIQTCLTLHLTERVMWGHSKKTPSTSQGGRASSETNPEGDLILDFQSPKLWEISV